MTIIDTLLAELEQESITTRRVLERVPQAHLSWKPHPKSMSLGQLELHVATVPGNVAELASEDTVSEPPAFVQQERAQVLHIRFFELCEQRAFPRRVQNNPVAGRLRSAHFSRSGRMCGNNSTSRIDVELVSSITSRSMPIPSPAVGGSPYSSAVM